MHEPGQIPMPGLLLADTGDRPFILIHPGHPPHLYLSSIGCFNLTKPLRHNENMDFFESRARVIALIDDLRAFAPDAFEHHGNISIPDAAVIVDGEPMNILADPPPA